MVEHFTTIIFTPTHVENTPLYQICDLANIFGARVRRHHPPPTIASITTCLGGESSNAMIAYVTLHVGIWGATLVMWSDIDTQSPM